MRKTPALALATALLLPLGLAACQDDSPVSVETSGSGSTEQATPTHGGNETGTNEATGSQTQTASEDGEEVSVFDINVGDCFNNPTSNDVVNKVYLVSCDAPHDAEVYTNQDITGYDSYPGDSTIQTEAQTICSNAFEPYVGTDYNASSYGASWFYPLEDSWNNAISPDRTVSCLLVSTDGSQLTGSGHNSGK